MNRNSNLILYFSYIAIFTMLAATTPYATGLIYGKIISASTCLPISGAKIYSSYNNNATNVSAQNGTYALNLGIGNWTVSVNAAGYYPESYKTPYVYNIELEHNFALLPYGGTIGSCLSGLKNTTIPSTVPSSNTTPQPKIPQPTINNTIPKNTTAATAPQQSNTDIYILIAVVLVIIIIIILLKKKRKVQPSVEEHFVHPQELIKK